MNLTPFVTGDSPIISLNNDNNDTRIFYYPISPNIAIKLFVIPRNPSYVKKINRSIKLYDESEVRKLNELIADAAVKYVFSNDLDVLKVIRDNRKNTF